jgi:predicted Zn finger-like uncharacterized protein
VNYSCLSCRAKYVIPDSRVVAAGAEGLRVRCSRCRAIMAVHASSELHARIGDDDPVTASGTNSMSRRQQTGPRPSLNPFAALPVLTSDGMAEGASRDVTGVFMPMLASIDAPASEASERLFFAALDGRSRGPFTAKEMLTLADKGRLRSSTLVWRAGAAGWRPLKLVSEYDVSWLLDAVKRRGRREHEHEDAALQKAGIAPILLERRAIRAVTAPTGAPALPLEAALDDDDGGPVMVPPTAAPRSRRLLWLGAAVVVVALAIASFALLT